MSTLLLLVLLLPLVCAVAGRLMPDRISRLRDAFFVAVTAAEAVFADSIFILQKQTDQTFAVNGFAGMGLSFKAGHFNALYCCITAFLWLITIIFAMEYLRHDEHRKRYCFYNLLTLTGVMGVFLSADLFTTFVFFEIMSFASYPLVIHEQTEDAMKAGETYLGVAVISGMMLLTGIFFVGYGAGTLNFDALRTFFAQNPVTPLTFAGGMLILLGFGAKAGMYPLHIWLPQAHPVAPSPASALLSGILTKTGVFGIIVLTADILAGNYTFGIILLVLAVITMFLGALLALFSVNLKRTLACSSMSQIGFILVGITFALLLGKEGGIAQNGALLHMCNHSLIKLVLFMCAGVVAMNIHALDLNAIKGYGRKKPFLAVVFATGALGIMGVPLFNGYVSKTMIHESITEYIVISGLSGGTMLAFKAVEWLFLLSGGLTVAYMTKLFVCLFIEKNSDAARQAEFDKNTAYLSTAGRIVFAVSALILPVIGLCPKLTVSNVTAPANEFFNVEVFTGNVEFFGLEALEGAAISIGIGAAVYFLLVRTVFIKKGRYVDLWNARLDLEALVYRPVIINGTAGFVKHIVAPVAYCFEWLATSGVLYFIKYVISPTAYCFEWLVTRGVLYFTVTVVRFFALLFDRIIVILNKTVLKAHVYEYKEQTFAMRTGELLDKLLAKKNRHVFAERMDSFTETVGKVASAEYASFSFAYAMISLGIIIVLLFAVFG